MFPLISNLRFTRPVITIPFCLTVLLVVAGILVAGILNVSVLAQRPNLRPTQEAPKDVDRLSSKLDVVGVIDDGDDSPEANAYRTAFAAWRSAMFATFKVKVDYSTDRYEKNIDAAIAWADSEAELENKVLEFQRAAVALYRSDPEKYVNIADLLYGMLHYRANADTFAGGLEMGQALLDTGYEGEMVLQQTLVSGIAENHYGEVRKLIEQYGDQKLPQISMDAIKSVVTNTEQNWQRELRFRELDADKDDLPRIKFLTTKGRIVIELFEDQAPNAVASMIRLTEDGYFRGHAFFIAEEKSHIQAGCELNNGTGTPGYTIAGEMGRMDARHHFRGSVGLALGVNQETGEADVNSGSSQFYITLLQSPPRDGRFTVIGRVIEGLHLIGRMQRVDLTTEEGRKAQVRPDAIISATVVRKRDHEYMPKISSGELPF